MSGCSEKFAFALLHALVSLSSTKDKTDLLPLSSNIRRSGVFRSDYVCVEKTLLPLIIKHWNSVWITKQYVLIKVAYPFPCIFPYMAVCMFFYKKDLKIMHN